MQELLTNGKGAISHKEKLNELLNKSKEIYIAVAFLKKSGLNLLLPYMDNDRKVSMLAGINFGITDPEALDLLLKFSKKPNVKAYLSKLNSPKIFHPKLYLIRDDMYCHVIIGSANLTNGGLSANNECSIYIRCNESDSIWNQAFEYYNDCIHSSNADILSQRIISIYRTYHKKQKKINEQSEVCPDDISNSLYNINRLREHFNKLDKVIIAEKFKEKEEKYKKAKKTLEKILRVKHTKNEFTELIENLVGKKGQRGLWYSNGMFRHKKHIFNQQELFRELIKTIKNNLSEDPSYIYDNAKKIAGQIRGVGPNFIGEIMMTYAPKKLANINRNPITVLRTEGQVDIKDHSSNFTGKDYKEYNIIIQEISEDLGLNNMLEMDYFFNKIYQKLKKVV